MWELSNGPVNLQSRKWTLLRSWAGGDLLGELMDLHFERNLWPSFEGVARQWSECLGGALLAFELFLEFCCRKCFPYSD